MLFGLFQNDDYVVNIGIRRYHSQKAAPNIMPFKTSDRGDEHIKIISGIIPKTNGSKHIKIKRPRFNGYDASATKKNLFFKFPIVTFALLG